MEVFFTVTLFSFPHLLPNLKWKGTTQRRPIQEKFAQRISVIPPRQASWDHWNSCASTLLEILEWSWLLRTLPVLALKGQEMFSPTQLMYGLSQSLISALLGVCTAVFLCWCSDHSWVNIYASFVTVTHFCHLTTTDYEFCFLSSCKEGETSFPI